MKSLKLLLISIFILISSNLIAQNSENKIILTIGNEKITQAEFERIYNKNKNIESTGVDNPIRNVNDYMELFINFKLKVIEAQSLGMDTTSKFVDELAGYRKQLAAPYLTDESVIDQLTKEAYERMKHEVAVSHIMIKLDANAAPKDTLVAYNKALDIYTKATSGGDFKALAAEFSEDPSAKTNSGYLGYFTVFRMVYPFENAAFNTPIGEVNTPIRTKFGYHVIKVDDKREANGRIKVAHIMLFTPKEMVDADLEKTKQKIDSIYAALKSGESFSELAKSLSEDKGTAVKGGELREFGTGEMVPEFEKAAFELKDDGEISKPVKSSYGWHIIKRISMKSLASFDDEKKNIENKVRRTGRTSKSKDVFIARLKKEYGFKQTKPLSYFYTVIDSTIFFGNWDINKASELKKTMFKFGKNKVNQQEFATFLNKKQRQEAVIPIENYVDAQYKQFIENTLIEFEETQLESKYPDFKYLMKEYHDGILLFDITNEKVWEKAIQDTLGLREFYANNKNNYTWKKRKEVIIYSCKTEEIAKNVLYDVKNREEAGDTNDDILDAINKEEKGLLTIKNAKYEKGINALVNKYSKKVGISKIVEENGRFIFIETVALLDAMPKELHEAKGIITSDYQDFLEKAWLKKLRAKYSYKINEATLKTIK